MAIPELLLDILILFGIACAAMVVVWLISILIDNTTVVDVWWSSGIFAYTAWALYPWQGTANIILTSMVGLWALRLAIFLFWCRIRVGHKDHRYVEMEKRWGENVNFKRLGGFIFQGSLQTVLVISFLDMPVPTQDSLLPLIGPIALYVIALIGETAADIQLQKHKEAGSGTICKAGLWSITRHPNYFFDLLTWISFALYVIVANQFSLESLRALVGPLTMWIIFRHITGPLTEAHSKKRRGDAYRDYQKETPMIIPFSHALNYEVKRSNIKNN